MLLKSSALAFSAQLLFSVATNANLHYFDASAPKFACDDGTVNAISSPGSPVPLGINTTLSSQTILFSPIPASDGRVTSDSNYFGRMCVFSRWTVPLTMKEEGQGVYLPLGRSVDQVNGGNWQRPPGVGGRQVKYKCGNAANSGDNFGIGDYLCQVTLPMTSKTLANGTLSECDTPYYMTYYEKEMIPRNVLSRFLQKFTFGPTSDELDALEAAFEDIKAGGLSHADAMAQLQTEWTAMQMDPTTFSTGKFTSLREFWRKRLNPRTFEAYPVAESGPAPCEKYSRWRKFAFTHNDVKHSQYLQWGNKEIGARGQTADPHRITVETVHFSVPTLAPSTSSMPTNSPSSYPTLHPTSSPSDLPSISSSPTASNILLGGGVEGGETWNWPSNCEHTIITRSVADTSDPNYDRVYEGSKSLSVGGGCYVNRDLGPCPTSKISESIEAGDTLRISFWVRTSQNNQVFQVSTKHYDRSKRWNTPVGDSDIVSRTLIKNANEWTKVEAIHTVGPDWTFNGGQILKPLRCYWYILRFQIPDSDAGFILDDARVEKVETPSNLDIKRGFISNPDFILDYKYWMNSDISPGHVTYDSSIRSNVAVLQPGKVLRQNIVKNAVPEEKNKFSFMVKLSGVQETVITIKLRMRFVLDGGTVENYYETPVTTTIVNDGSGSWQKVFSDEFTMFGPYKMWSGYPNFIWFTVSHSTGAGGELRIANFQMENDSTTAPTDSLVPSSSPTTLSNENTAYIIRYAGEIRTVIKHPFQIDGTGEVLPMDSSARYTLCDVDEFEGALAKYPANKMSFFINDQCRNIRGGNPTVDIDLRAVNQSDLHILDLSNLSATPINIEQTRGSDWLLQTDVDDEVCSTFPSPYDNDYRGADPANPDMAPNRFNPDQPVFAILPDGSYALYDPRLLMQENSLELPLMDGAGNSVVRSTIRANNKGLSTSIKHGKAVIINDENIVLCANDAPNFINRDTCVLSYEENACFSDDLSFNDVSIVITFDDKSLSALHNASLDSPDDTGSFIYAASNLRYDDTNTDGTFFKLPCNWGNPKSRWVPRPDVTAEACTNTLRPDTVNAFKFLLESSNDENPFIRDIKMWNNKCPGGCCHPSDDMVYGMMIMTDTEGCWENVHPDHLTVFDFTKSINPLASIGVSVTSFANTGILEYPSTQSMAHFENLSSLTRVARYGDKMIVEDFAALVKLDTNSKILSGIANELGKVMVSNKVQANRGGGVLVCGSPNEVGPDPELDDYFDVIHEDIECKGCQNSYEEYEKQKQTVWAMTALEAEDQLCQRMAWALYEHLNVGRTTNPANTESNLYLYDIFTRNCFGNYFNVLKEMVFSPKMGEQFNYMTMVSSRYGKARNGQLIYPDENFGREVMQLFTIGLHELQTDGSARRDRFGRVQQTYDNFDVLTNARIFTGFDYSPRRGNNEGFHRSEKSRMDPLKLNTNKHDFLPKTSVNDGWIGDRYPLCIDLPPKHFLKIGGTYQFMGSRWNGSDAVKRFVLNRDSSLHQKLCNPDYNGNCNFSNTVVLEENLSCYGNECEVDTVTVVQVAPGAFYRYIRQPCIQFSFYEGGKKVITGFGDYQRGKGRSYTHSMCAHPKLPVAGNICCGLTEDDRAHYNYRMEYHVETVTAQTNKDKCEAAGLFVCDPNYLSPRDPDVQIEITYNDISPTLNKFFWTDASCTQKIKVRDDGMVALIHNPTPNPSVSEKTVSHVDLKKGVTFIKVPWKRSSMTGEEVFPSAKNFCGSSGACDIVDGFCLCDVTVEETFAFNSLPTRRDILASLYVGAVNPASYTDVTYSSFASSSDVEVFVSSDSGKIGDISTIFKVTDEFGEVAYFKNMLSNISLGGSYMLRNPVGFIDPADVDVRDVEYEVDAFLKHLFHYQSTAPFICKKLIQYFGVSNPSPAYVTRVVKAFTSGSFISRGASFGDGKYGSLAATVAAITLDAESLSPVIDDDTVSGNIREPLLKVIQVMRSLSFKRNQHIRLRHGFFMSNVASKIGQMVFEPPDQFSFFSSDYAPSAFSDIELVSPEAELLSMEAVVGITNGLFSLINYGLAYANSGFGPWITALPDYAGDYKSSIGTLTFQAEGSDISSKVNDLSTMITAGRLSAENKNVLIDAYNYFKQAGGEQSADRALLQLLTSSPEFHTSNTVYKTGSPRSITTQPAPQDVPYQAIIYIDLSGGADSFNILAPHNDGGCYLYNDYARARGSIGLKIDKMLPIDGSSAGIDGCGTFGVNSLLPAYRDIYNEGKGIFLANMGHLHKPVSKSNWMTETNTDLFSHTTMKAESHRVDAFREGKGQGVLGRLLDVLQEKGLSVSSTSTAQTIMSDGDSSKGRMTDVITSNEPSQLYERKYLAGKRQDLRRFLTELHSDSNENSGVFANLWSQSFLDVWNKTESLSKTIASTPLQTQMGGGGLDGQLKLIAKLIAAREKRGVNRDVFYAQLGGFDAHSGLHDVMQMRLPAVNSAVRSFWAEIKKQGIANNVVVIQGSEFGRTITPNSNAGSDHAWGGNYFIFGGDVKGGKILGEYPRSFGTSSSVNIGRGRLIPTTSWDSLWHGVAQWFGITDPTEIDKALPNAQNFGCQLFTDKDIFSSGSHALVGCGGPEHRTSFDFELPEPRYLIGREQKDICKLAVSVAAKRLQVDEPTIRCYIDNQSIVQSLITSSGFSIYGEAVLNFDSSIEENELNNGFVNKLAKTVARTASDFVVVEAFALAEDPPTATPSARRETAVPSTAPTSTLLPTPTTTTAAPSTSFPTYTTTTELSLSATIGNNSWYPDLDNRLCLNDGLVPQFMLQPGYIEWYTFSTESACCENFDCSGVLM